MTDQIDLTERATAKPLTLRSARSARLEGRTAMKAFSNQALALGRIFSCTVLALEQERTAEEKSQNSCKQTIENGNSSV